jgi:prepilin-type N-terminal cleavage/methylation domain-containing protein
MSMNGFHKLTTRGFTLIEAMVAVTILTLSIAGPLFTANSAIVAAETARDQLTASYLAQEGIEYVREMRDDAYLNAYRNNDPAASADAWADFIGGSSVWSITSCIAIACTLDPTRAMGHVGGSLEAYSGNAPLYLLTNGVYSQQNLPGSQVQPFTRTIQAFTVSASDERIVSTVTWRYHTTTYTVTIYDHLTPWQ